ncbi:hypothetical protein QTL95_24585 [Rhizobium sp. S152]|uniref:hypothetical protein n=1 Tax=Rhizobium sp. S152 TaxID=3055038 RepID=UPI0025A99390|nr:hypothetical protein [Rhizobium sp. S152]MDM9629071.1 hypothetical protein [Rhizobium sp. S152]
MAGEVAAEIPKVAELFGRDSFAFSFIFGAVVIALYAGKRLGELISPPKDEEYDFTKMLSLSTMVGQDVYYRSYVFYVFLLEFFYLILCMFQPLTDVLLDKTNKIVFEGTTWPLAAALLVVGVLPATPVVVQIEQSLRRFAHNMAQIPDDFYNRVTALSTQDIEAIVSNVGEYAPEGELFWTVRNLLIITGFDQDEAVRKARKCASLRLFGEWTLDRKELWSQSEYQKYRDVIDLLRPRYELLSEQLAELIRSSENTDFVSAVTATVGVDIRRKIDDPESLERLRTPAENFLSGSNRNHANSLTPKDVEQLKHMRDSWSKLTKECDTAAKRLMALFAIIARNDRRTLRELERPVDAAMLTTGGIAERDGRFKDPVLRAFAQLIRSDGTTKEPWYNSLLMSSVLVVVVSALAIGIYRIATENSAFLDLIHVDGGRSTIDVVVRTGFLKAGLDAVCLTLAFWFGAATALFLRSAKLRNQEWLTFYDFQGMPISSYGGILLASSVAAFPALMLQYVAYYKFVMFETGASDLLHTMLTNIGVAVSIGVYSVGLCILTDIISLKLPRNEKTLYLILSVGPIALNAFTLIISPGYLAQPVYLLNQVLLFIIVCVGGLIVYGRSLESRMIKPTITASDGLSKIPDAVIVGSSLQSGSVP